VNASGAARAWFWAIVLVATFFAAVAPTLTMLEFSNGSEGLNVSTAMEIRRTGHWLVPTLQGKTRLAKPPLTAWITASAMRLSTLAEIRSTDAVVRDRAFRALSWQVRLPALAAACIALLATFAMVRTVLASRDDRAAALVSVAVAASMMLLLRFCRYATTDVYMLMWVAVANALLARAAFSGQWWAGCIGAGAVLGLSILTKGPVAFLQTMIPAVLFAAIGPRVVTPALPRRVQWRPVLAGLAVALLIGLPWFVIVAARESAAWQVWFSEVSRIDATDAAPDAWYSQLLMILYATPWMIYLIAGLLGSAVATARRKDPPLVFAATMLVVPLVIMSLFKDRVIRYTLPLVPAASLVAAIAVVRTTLSGDAADPRGALARGLAWGTLAGSRGVGDPVSDRRCGTCNTAPQRSNR
jgi:4-amino-4-deoxy-L-arabinose transferase-like glycosyltransferase